MGLVLLKSVRFGKAVEESVAYFNGIQTAFQLGDEFTQKASPMYKRLIQFCLNEEVEAFKVQALEMSICAYNFVPADNTLDRSPMPVNIGSYEVEVELPR